MSNPDGERLRAVEAQTAAAHSKIDKHEAACGERWKAAHETMQRVDGKVDALSTKMWAAAGSIIGLLLVIVLKMAGVW